MTTKGDQAPPRASPPRDSQRARSKPPAAIYGRSPQTLRNASLEVVPVGGCWQSESESSGLSASAAAIILPPWGSYARRSVLRPPVSATASITANDFRSILRTHPSGLLDTDWRNWSKG